MSSVNGLACVVLAMPAGACAAPEILRSGDEIRLDLRPTFADLHMLTGICSCTRLFTVDLAFACQESSDIRSSRDKTCHVEAIRI